MDLFGEYLIPLGPLLLPSLKSLILALLPGLEEEGNEFFDKVFSLLNSLKENVGSEEFFKSVWLCLLLNPQFRISALNYLLRIAESKECFVINDVKMISKAISATLSDSHILVIRGMLELLVTRFPIKAELFQTEDLIFISQFVLEVLLKRDMSLNRRVHAWFLGSTDGQTNDSLDEFSKEIIVKALKEMLYNFTSNLAVISKPYRILVSLMDKEEIGNPVLGNIFMDTLLSIHKKYSQAIVDSERQEILQTGNIFFEVVELSLVWKELKDYIQVNFTQESLEDNSCSLFKFSLEKLKICDEESMKIHMPILFFSWCNQLSKFDFSNQQSVYKASEGVSVCMDLFRLIPQTALSMGSLNTIYFLTNPSSVSINEPIEKFYKRSVDENNLDLELFSQFSGSILQHSLLDLSMLMKSFIENNILKFKPTPSSVCELFTKITNLISTITTYKSESNELAYKKIVSSSNWLKLLFDCTYQVEDVDIIYSALVCMKNLVANGFISVSFVYSHLNTLCVIQNLWNLLDDSFQKFHFRVAEMYWIFFDIFGEEELDEFFSRNLIVTDVKNKICSMKKFAAFWKMSDSLKCPTVYFSRPLFLMIDTLYDVNSEVKRNGQTWFTSSIKHFTRVINPILVLLLNSRISCREEKSDLFGIGLNLHIYTRAFNYGQTSYALKCLLTLAEYGRGNFIDFLRSSPIHEDLVEHVSDNCKLFCTSPGRMIYSELIFSISCWFSCVICPASFEFEVTSLIDVIQYKAQSLVSYLLNSMDSWSQPLVSSVLPWMTDMLLLSLRNSKYEQQTILLQIIKSLIKLDYPPNERLVLREIIIVGLTEKICSTTLNWLEFYLSIIPHTRNSNELVPTILEKLNIKMLAIVGSMELNRDPFLISEDELSTILTIVLKMASFCLEEVTEMSPDKVGSMNFKQWTFFVKDVFVSETPFIKSYSVVKTDLISFLNSFLMKLDRYLCFFRSFKSSCVSLTKSTEYQCELIRSQIAHFVRSLYGIDRLLTIEILLSLHHIKEDFNIRSRSNSEDLKDSEYRKSFLNKLRTLSLKELDKSLKLEKAESVNIESLLDFFRFLPCSLNEIVNAVLFIYKNRVVNPEEKNCPITTCDLISFLEIFVRSNMKGNVLLELWNNCSIFVKDIMTTPTKNKHVFFYLLCWITEVSRKSFIINSEEERRIVRDIQEMFIKVAEYCILMAAKSSEQGFNRRNTREFDRDDSRSGSSLRRKDTEERKDEEEIFEVVCSYLCSTIIPELKSLLSDPEKIIALCNSLMYYVVAPNMKNSKNYEAQAFSTNILFEISKMPFTIKCWRKEIWDLFLDSKFFQTSLIVCTQRMEIIQVLLLNEPEKFSDLLSKLGSSSSANIFSSKDMESLNKCLLLKRISFVIFSGDKDQYVPSLPILLEKIVDLLRASRNLIQAEIFMLFRVILLKVSNQFLSNFWPVLLNELTAVFNDIRKSTVEIKGDNLKIFFSACKCVDIMLTIASDEIMSHQWLFISEILGSEENSKSAGVIDRLRQIWIKEGKFQSLSLPAVIESKRRPLIQSKSVSKASELEPFVFNVGYYAMKHALELHEPDFPFIKNALLHEFLEDE